MTNDKNVSAIMRIPSGKMVDYDVVLESDILVILLKRSTTRWYQSGNQTTRDKHDMILRYLFLVRLQRF